MQTILGANGTIGKPLAKELKAYTDRIRLVSRQPGTSSGNTEAFPADLTDPEQAMQAVKGSEVAYLVVGLDYRLGTWQQLWPRLMRNVLDACIRHETKLVFFDNVYLYDKKAVPHMTEQSPVNPPSGKGRVRQQIASMLMQEVEAGRLQALIARAPDFYGPENHKSFAYEVIYRNLKKGKQPLWMGKSDLRHSFIYTPDAAKATAILGNTPDAYGQAWHLPTHPDAPTGRQFIRWFGQEMGSPKKPMVMPTWMVRTAGLFSPLMKELGEMMYQYDQEYFFDSSKFTRRFDFQPTPYLDGIRETIRIG
jgi:nucleoside-diphosphate-sugar epimerase